MRVVSIEVCPRWRALDARLRHGPLRPQNSVICSFNPAMCATIVYCSTVAGAALPFPRLILASSFCALPYFHRTFAVLLAPAVEAATPVQTGSFRKFLEACPPRRFPPLSHVQARADVHPRSSTARVNVGGQQLTDVLGQATPPG